MLEKPKREAHGRKTEHPKGGWQMKEMFVEPEVELIELAEDVITSSCTDQEFCPDHGPDVCVGD